MTMLVVAACLGASSDVYLSWFDVNKTSGQLQLSRTDQLSTLLPTDSVELVVKATDDCSSGYWEMTAHRRHVTSTTHDASLLLVRVTVVMATRFTTTSLYAALAPQAQTGYDVIRLSVSGPVLTITYY